MINKNNNSNSTNREPLVDITNMVAKSPCMKPSTQTPDDLLNCNDGKVDGGEICNNHNLVHLDGMRKKRKEMCSISPIIRRKRRRCDQLVTIRNPETPRLGKKQQPAVKPRGINTIARTIKRNPRYKTMRNHVQQIAEHCANTQRCPICSHKIVIDGLAIRTAIDHLHVMEDDNDVCAFRDLLCQYCNTTEGQSLKDSLKTETTHVDIWMKKRFGGILTPKSKEIVRPRMESLLSKGHSITPLLFDRDD